MRYHEKDFAYLLGLYRERAGFIQQELAYKISVHRNTIASWEARGPLPKSRGQVLRLADELFLTTEERKAFVLAAGFSTERWPTEVWTVPQQRDMFFTGRGDVFQSLRKLLVPGSVTALTQAISGLGGIGKTATAVEYAYRHHQYYEAVLWLQADSWEVLTSECIKLADELGLPEQQEIDQIVAEVQRWLRKHRHWLLILDNVENPQEILPKFVPTGHQGCVLVTTRVHNVDPLAQTQVLAAMSEQEGILFLLRRTKKIASAAGLEQASSEQRDEARQIWQLMDGLPLALDQAGAYILETGSSIPAYHEQYTRRREELLHRRGKRFIGHKASVTTTFSLAFDRIEALNPVASDVLRACSLLHNEAIPEELFQIGAEHLGPRLATERERWDLALAVLQDYSLVQRNTDTKTLTIHRLVQAVLQGTLEESERHIWAERAMRAVNVAFPQVEHHTWSRCERLLPQALAATQLIEQYRINVEEAGHLLLHLGTYLKERARYTEAESLCKRAVAIYEQQLGIDHPDTVQGLNCLALVHHAQGRYAEAEPLLKRALALSEQQLGAEHPITVASLNNLAALYKSLGKYSEAERLYQQALKLYEQQLGAEHPFTLVCLSNLAELYWTLNKYAEAERLLQQILPLLEQQLGPEHPMTVQNLNNLAMVYHGQGKDAQAEPLLQRVLAAYEQQLGPEHPTTAICLNNLAEVYQHQGKYAEAEPLLQRVLAAYEQQLGPEHPTTAICLNNLGQLYWSQGRYAEAEPLLKRALALSERLLGAKHPFTVSSLNNLGGPILVRTSMQRRSHS